MAMRYLGDEFDIHTGGVDNVFPHHEDEIAQSASLTGRPPARHWVHGEFLLMSGRKMAKSAGNFQRITELAEAGFDPLAFRYLALTSRSGRELHGRMVSAVDDDLDTPTALAVVREMLRASLSPDERRWLVLDADLVLGLDLDRVWADVSAEDDGLQPDQRRLLEERSAARARRDFPRADALRAALLWP